MHNGRLSAPRPRMRPAQHVDMQVVYLLPAVVACVDNGFEAIRRALFLSQARSQRKHSTQQA